MKTYHFFFINIYLTLIELKEGKSKPNIVSLLFPHTKKQKKTNKNFFRSLSPTHPSMLPPGIPQLRGVGTYMIELSIWLSVSIIFAEWFHVINEFNKEYGLIGVTPAGARVPLRGPMARGEYGELSLIQLYYYRPHHTRAGQQTVSARALDEHKRPK